MKKKSLIVFVFLVGGFFGVLLGFLLGIYFLPILIEEKPATIEKIQSAENYEVKMGEFIRDLKGSDRFHWGEGKIILSHENFEGGKAYFFTLQGKVAPGPDYRLYVTKKFIEDEEEFLANEEQVVEVAKVKAFTNFRYRVPNNVDILEYNNVMIWCHRFKEFITSARLH